ncbi:MAG: hypothetical protein ACFFCW_11490 [Candidatus Hodarchaeota archaeon]
MNEYLDAASRLHEYLNKCWKDSSMAGPTLGGKYYYNTIRLLRAYFPSISREKEIFYQGLGYWIKSNWKLFDLTKDLQYMNIALACSDFVIGSQNNEGSWQFPQNLMKLKIYTNGGTWASLGLLETYKRTKEDKYLISALKWYNLLIGTIGFQKHKDSLAINYSIPARYKVPNATTPVLWFLAELSCLTKNQKYLDKVDKLRRFVELSQMENGELMYTTETPHFLCLNYNAFQFLDLAEFYSLTSDEAIYRIMRNLVTFIKTGVNYDGSVRYNCFKRYPSIIYYSAAVGCVFLRARKIGFGDFSELENKVYKFVLTTQKPNGGFPFSRKEHLVLSDKMFYPYINEYILYHLLIKAEELV